MNIIVFIQIKNQIKILFPSFYYLYMYIVYHLYICYTHHCLICIQNAVCQHICCCSTFLFPQS